MTQINFGDDLADQLRNEVGAQAKKPFKTWYISPVTLGKESYYLYVEKLTGLPIITQKLSTFTYIFENVLHELGFLTAKQQERINRIVTETIQYRYNPDETSPLIAEYKQAIKKHQEELTEGLTDEAKLHLPENDLMSDFSLSLCALLDEKHEILKHFCRVANDVIPIKIGKPRPGTSYCTITPQFRDPRDWEKFIGQDPAKNHQTVLAIQDNNVKMIEQFFRTEYGKTIKNRDAAEDVLGCFLNDFLFHDQIDLVTTNLAAVNQYYWDILVDGPNKFPMDVLDRFFTFLSHAGIVNKPAAEHVAENLQHAIDTFTGANEVSYDAMNEMLANHPQMIDDDYDLIMDAIDRGDFPEIFRDTLAEFDANKKQAKVAKVRYTNPAQVKMTYKIRVTLADFTPQMSRVFYIAGDQSIETLQTVIIDIFHGYFGPMFDLVNEKTGDCYMSPFFLGDDFPLQIDAPDDVIDASEATVSILNKGDQLVLTYDYNDDWEFNVTVEELVPNYVGYQPIVSEAKGYGIIEDIGGTGALKEYYRKYQHGDVDPDFKEWLGGELIDLDSVDINELNLELREDGE